MKITDRVLACGQGRRGIGSGFLILVVSALWSASSQAQHLSLDRALEEARARNPGMLAFRQDAEIARVKVEKASYWSQFNPTLEGGAGQRRFDGGGTSVQPLGSLAIEVEVAGQRGKRIEEAERNLRRVDAEIRNAERILTAEVKQSFYRALYLERRVELLRRVEELNRRLRDASAERFKRGEVPKLEANLAVVRYSQARKDALTAAAEYQNGLRAIERLLGREPLGVVEIDGDLTGRPLGASLSALLEAARENRPDLHARNAEIERIAAEADLNRRLIVPNPTFKGFYDEETELPGMRDQIFGGSISIPLPLFDRRQAERSALAAQQSRADFDRAATVLTVETEVRDAYRSYEAALEAIAVFEADAIGRTGENFRLIETSYEAGKSDLLQLIVTQNEIVAIELSYLESQFAYWEARVLLERAVGNGNGGD